METQWPPYDSHERNNAQHRQITVRRDPSSGMTALPTYSPCVPSRPVSSRIFSLRAPVRYANDSGSDYGYGPAPDSGAVSAVAAYLYQLRF